MRYSAQRVHVLLALVLLATVGCGDNIPFDAEQARREARETHFAWLGAFLDADAERFASTMWSDVVDLGGGATGTGELPPEFVTVEYWEQRFASEAYTKSFEGKTMDDVIDVRGTRALFFSELQDMGPHYFGEDTIFVPRTDDVWVISPTPPGSPLGKVWFAVYRKIGGEWKVVGLD